MSALPTDLGDALLRCARNAVAERLGLPASPPAVGGGVREQLDRPGASFVTLTLSGRLRGCIGSLRPVTSLGRDVSHNAVAAAFDDPRFAPLTTVEFPRLRIEVSVLSAPQPLAARDEAAALAALRPGRDGVVLSEGRRRATFLPQVWEEIPDAHDFLVALRRKAGLPPDRWGPGTQLETYTVSSCQEPR